MKKLKEAMQNAYEGTKKNEASPSKIAADMLDDGKIGEWWRDEITSPAAGDPRLWLKIADELIKEINSVKKHVRGGL